MDDDQRLQVLSAWLNGSGAAGIIEQVRVRTKSRAEGRETVVSIDHRLSCDLDAHDGWHVHTRPTFLPRAHFSSEATHYLKTASPERGRAIYCVDQGVGEVVAAVSYHLDIRPHIPVVLTTLAPRNDSAENAFLRYRSLAGLLVVKRYIHAMAEKVGRGGHVDLDLQERRLEDLARELGFRKAPKIKNFGAGGLHLRQPAPSA
jgi:hypothetical protein